MNRLSVPARTIIDRIWDAHVVARPEPGQALLAIDRIFLHERTGPALLAGLAASGRAPRHPARIFGVMDHIVSTLPGRNELSHGPSARSFITEFRNSARSAGIRLFDLDDRLQGIVHVVSPEQGLALPGLTLVCPDSHTGTVGGLGALAWGIGSTEGEHAVATGTLLTPEPKRMRVRFDGVLPGGVVAKDMILALIGRFGASGGAPGGVAHAIEFAGPAVRGLPIEGRLTLCNMAVEFGAWTGLIAPDEDTLQWVAGRPHAPQGAHFDQAAAHWLALRSDDDAAWDAEITLDVANLAPQVSWGTSPEHTSGVDGIVPDPAQEADAARRRACEQALAYMALKPGQSLAGTPIDAAFIGSCTNSRLSDLRAAAAMLRGAKVAPDVKAIVVPGSTPVKAAAEAEGLHRVFEDAGFEWRASGCSLCFFSGGDSFGFAEGSTRRVISSTNRNFEGRQGPGVRTHLASPLTVVASALAGHITDPRPYLES